MLFLLYPPINFLQRVQLTIYLLYTLYYLSLFENIIKKHSIHSGKPIKTGSRAFPKMFYTPTTSQLYPYSPSRWFNPKTRILYHCTFYYDGETHFNGMTKEDEAAFGDKVFKRFYFATVTITTLDTVTSLPRVERPAASPSRSSSLCSLGSFGYSPRCACTTR